MQRKSDLQSVMHQFLSGYREHHSLSPRQTEVCDHIDACRTEALGGVQLHCDQCGYEQPWYQACGDRHCPKCAQHYPIVETIPNLLPPDQRD